MLILIVALALADEPVQTTIRMVEAPGSVLSARERTLPALPPGVPAPGEKLRCTVHVQVTGQGVPDTVAAADCDPALEAPSVAAARRWRFRPAWAKGKPARAEIDLVVTAVTR